MPVELPDYFANPPSPEQAVLRQVKGNARRAMITAHLRSAALESIPEDWMQHDLPEELKAALQAQHPQARGGEDLPDLLPGEVEIARMSLVDSIHGEATSLRGRPSHDGNTLELRLVDEYETEYTLADAVVAQALSATQVLKVFSSADPSPLETSCEVSFSSFFYQDLDATAAHLRIRPA